MSIQRQGPWPKADEPQDARKFPAEVDLGEGLSKSTLERGRLHWWGWFPQQGDEVFVEYEAFLPSGEKFDSSQPEGTDPETGLKTGGPYKWTVGTSRVLIGWDRAVQTMCTGEYAELSVPSQLAHGEKGLPGLVPPNTDLTFKMRLVKWVSSSLDLFKDGGVYYCSLDRLKQQHEGQDTAATNQKTSQTNAVSSDSPPSEDQLKSMLGLNNEEESPSDSEFVDAPPTERKIVSYVGALPDGRVFTRKHKAEYSSKTHSAKFQDLPREDVISGILQCCRVGETIRVICSPEYAFGEAGFRYGDVDVPPNSEVVWDFTLDHPINLIDVSPEGLCAANAITKQTLKYTSDRSRPNLFGACVVALSATDKHGGAIYSNDSLEFTTGLVDCWALDSVVREMGVGETVQMTCHDEELGAWEKIGVLPTHFPVTYVIKLAEITRPGCNVINLDTEDRINVAAEIRANATDVFKLGRFRHAALWYRDAADALADSGPGFGAPQVAASNFTFPKHL